MSQLSLALLILQIVMIKKKITDLHPNNLGMWCIKGSALSRVTREDEPTGIMENGITTSKSFIEVFSFFFSPLF